MIYDPDTDRTIIIHHILYRAAEKYYKPQEFNDFIRALYRKYESVSRAGTTITGIKVFLFWGISILRTEICKCLIKQAGKIVEIGPLSYMRPHFVDVAQIYCDIPEPSIDTDRLKVVGFLDEIPSKFTYSEHNTLLVIPPLIGKDPMNYPAAYVAHCTRIRDESPEPPNMIIMLPASWSETAGMVDDIVKKYPTMTIIRIYPNMQYTIGQLHRIIPTTVLIISGHRSMLECDWLPSTDCSIRAV
jgi:hypothetical protein